MGDSIQRWRGSNSTRRVGRLRWCSRHGTGPVLNWETHHLHGSSPSSSCLGGNPTVSLPPAGVMRYNSCPSIPAWPFSIATASDELVPCAGRINTRPSFFPPCLPFFPDLFFLLHENLAGGRHVCSVGPDAKIYLCVSKLHVSDWFISGTATHPRKRFAIPARLG